MAAGAVDLCLDGLLGQGEAFVHHQLVVQYKLHLALVLRVEVVLTGREVVFLFSERCRVRVFAIQKRSAVWCVLPQVVVERVLTVASAMHGAEAAVIL